MRVQWVPLALIAAAGCSDITGSGVLEAPATVSSVSLDGAILLTWSDNAYQDDPDLFESYRVYSTSYDLDLDLCGTDWSLEGTTVAPEFLAGALANGVPRCFHVTAMSRDDTESDRSPLHYDTPRPDARNVLLYAVQEQPALSGFRFWDDLDNDGLAQPDELGRVGSGLASDIDFYVDRDGLSGDLFLVPERPGTGVEFYSPSPVEDLTSVDYAPFDDYSAAPIEALVGFGYVFEMDGGDGFARFGAVRVTHVGPDFLVLDWAFQTDPGNIELKVGASP